MSAQGQHKASFVTKVTDVATSTKGPAEPLGCIRYENGKKYKYVKYDFGTAELVMAAGNILGYLASDTSMTTVCVDETDCFNLGFAGVAVSVIADDGYGWIQIGGLSGILTTDIAGSPSVGDLAQMSSTDDTLTKTVTATVPSFCWVVNATASTNTVYLFCPE